jgi:hemerythrin
MYKWDASLETGYEEIDNQHKQCVVAVNKTIEAVKQGKGKEAIKKTLDFLAGYIIIHFMAEEELMYNNNYSDYSIHRRYHEEFRVTVGELIERFVSEGPTDELINVVIYTIGDWLVNHIKGDDFRMAAFIKTKKTNE